MHQSRAQVRGRRQWLNRLLWPTSWPRQLISWSVMRGKAPGPASCTILNISQLCLLLGGASLFLTGCTAHPRFRTVAPPQTVSPILNVITLTPDELRRAEDHAYDNGFAAGRAYERQHRPYRDLNDSARLITSTPLQPQPVSPPQPPAQPAPIPAPLPASTPDSPQPQTKTTPIYSPSGPALPLSPSSPP